MAPRATGIEIAFRPDPRVYDGRFANNAWLQELPKPMTKLTWDNAALMSPGHGGPARRVDRGPSPPLARRTIGGGPGAHRPGHADEAVTLHLGYGRDGDEGVARGVGFDAYRLRHLHRAVGRGRALKSSRSEAPDTPSPGPSSHWSTDGRPIALRATLPSTRATRTSPPSRRPAPFAPPAPAGLGRRRTPQWAMTIDLVICTGCSACVVACQAENNIPVVGKEQVLKGREMHWLRIDTLLTSGRPRRPRVVHQPMLCQHCEKAPCEYVCPVNATVHSPDGLNEMVYNRCVGTRFCSNNCPYKVRRFNWFDYHATSPRTQAGRLQRNPDVTVRERGVMEKCTYCVQRIRAAEIRARDRGAARSATGEVVDRVPAGVPDARDPVRRRSATPDPRWCGGAREPRTLRRARTSSARGRARATSRGSTTRTRSSPEP